MKNPLYKVVMDRLVERIATGAMPPGSMLPSEIQLGQELGVAQGTAREALSEGLDMRIEGGAIAGVDQPLVRPAEKLALFAQTRAKAADMESHVVARAAVAAGVPFVVLRVVSDPSNRALPRAAVVGITEEGRIDGGAVAGALLRRPWDSIDMMTLALDGAQAMHRLRRVGRRAAPLLLSL